MEERLLGCTAQPGPALQAVVVLLPAASGSVLEVEQGMGQRVPSGSLWVLPRYHPSIWRRDTEYLSKMSMCEDGFF